MREIFNFLKFGKKRKRSFQKFNFGNLKRPYTNCFKRGTLIEEKKNFRQV
jgi:hypothetical protein